MSFYKNVRLTDRVKLQFRFDIFNVFKRVNFLNVNNTMSPSEVTFDTPDAANATKITSYTVSNRLRPGGCQTRSAAGAVRPDDYF